jgi:hypothetical protein
MFHLRAYCRAPQLVASGTKTAKLLALATNSTGIECHFGDHLSDSESEALGLLLDRLTRRRRPAAKPAAWPFASGTVSVVTCRL